MLCFWEKKIILVEKYYIALYFLYIELSQDNIERGGGNS